MVDNGSMVEFLKKKDYVMINNNLGSGSFGTTVLLKDPFIDELFVSKKYDPEFAEDKEEFYSNFLQEIKIMHKLNHRNVVRIYNYYAYPDAYTGFILMEYVDGIRIDEYFEKHMPWDTPTPDDVFVQLIDGFSYIESEGIAHRDIREGNIMIDNTGSVKIIDFGLGKTFKPIDDRSADSMKGIINRSGLDKLPNEYYEGKYTSKTDMFYLAELFNRLLRKSDYYDEFSYKDILLKMMEADESDRYMSFSDVKNAIEQHRFSVIDIPEEDKEKYQDFANGLFSVLASFTTNEKEFVDSVPEFIERIKNVVEKNCFETFIQDNRDVISTIVKNAGYKYFERTSIRYSAVADFYKWIIRLPDELKLRVINNLRARMADIKTEVEDELPF